MSKFTIFNLQDHYEKEKNENERKKKQGNSGKKKTLQNMYSTIELCL